MSRPQSVEASAPTRVLLLRGVAVALDRRATCRVERASGGVCVESKDALVRAEAGSLDELRAPAALRPFARLLRELGLERGVRVSAQARVPMTAGLASDVAQAVAGAAALLRFCGRAAPLEEVTRLAALALAAAGAPADPLDLAVATRGSVVAGVDGRPARVAADPARVEEALLLADVGVFARADARAGSSSDGERAQAAEAVAALIAGDADGVAARVARAWRATRDADPTAATPEADAALAAVESCGGAGRPCGAAGGGLVVLWLPPHARAAGQARLAAAGVRTFRARVDLLGLALEP